MTTRTTCFPPSTGLTASGPFVCWTSTSRCPKNKRLREAKELIYKNAIAKQTAILKALKEEQDADKERIDYLNGLNILLQSAINDLKHDLGLV